MAASSSYRSTKSGTRKSSSKSTAKRSGAVSEAQRVHKHRMWSAVLSVLGVFLFFVTWLKGESLWNTMQMIIWGLFGVSAALVAPIILYVSIMMALDKSKSAVVTKLIQGFLLIMLVSPLFELVHSGDLAFSGESFSEKITLLYNSGAVDRQGGGALSIFLGGLLTSLCGWVCALIIIILLVLLFVMLLTNITLIDVIRVISRLFVRIKKSVSESSEEAAIRRLEREEEEKQRLAVEEKNRAKETTKPATVGFVDLSKYLSGHDEPAASEKSILAGDDSKSKDKKLRQKQTEMPQIEEAPKIEETPQIKEAPADFIADNISKDDAVPAPIAPTPITAAEADIIEKAEAISQSLPEPIIIPENKPAAVEENNDILDVDVQDGTINPIFVDKDGQTTLIEMEDADITGYSIPPIELLNPPQRSVSDEDTAAESEKNAETLVETLKSFGVVTRIVGIHRGPSVTRYELQPAAGVKVSKITNLADDIALNLAANGVRIEAPIPGKAAVGIELANKARETVCIRELVDSDAFRNAGGKLCFPVGKDIEGKIIIGDISKMPHILIAGTTGSGKSVFTNSIIMSILYNASPDEVKLILVDPKQVEFPVYNGIPHLLIPVVTEAKKAAGALGWAVTEMLKRYKLFADNGVRDLKDYNKMAAESDVLSPMPQIVIVVDELADLMMAAPKEVEDSICRLAQLARAAGMHLIIATQSPRVDIVTGLIKANIPSRVALKVSNQMDSRVILDEGGAEKLLGNGDLLYKPVGLGKPVRVQGSYVATEEIKRAVDFLKAQTSSQYDEEVASEVEKHIPVPKGEKQAQESASDSGSDGNMTERAAEAVIEAGQASTSYLQRKLKLGYARAARIMDELEELGVVGPADGAKPREVRMSRGQWLERKASMSGNGDS